MNKKSTELLKKHFNFLNNISNFEIQEIKSSDYALYAKYISNSVGIIFNYEFRDFIPRILFTKLDLGETLTERPGLYTIRELYRKPDFKLNSFYLDEILLKSNIIYKDYFNKVKTVEEAIKNSAELVQEFAFDFVKGNEVVYKQMDSWYRNQVKRDSA